MTTETLPPTPTDPTPADQGDPGPLHRITVNLTGKAHAAMLAAGRRDGYSRTDTINRALQVYDVITGETKNGTMLLLKAPDGEITLLRII